MYHSCVKLDLRTPSVTPILRDKVLDPCFNKARKVNFSNCTSTVLVSAKVTSSLIAGLGHRMSEFFFIFRFAVLQGFCICFDVETFGRDVEFYHLVLKSIIPDCTLFRRRREVVSWDTFEKFRKSNQLLEEHLYLISFTLSDIWPPVGTKTTKGSLHIFQFFDNFVQSNCLLSHSIVPWYLSQRSTNVAETIKPQNPRAVNAVFHIRVGDIILESAPEYWKHLMMTFDDIVRFESSENMMVNVFFSFFNANHKWKEGKRMRKSLLKNGEKWSNVPSLLPQSHSFIAKLCHNQKHLRCLWKSGCHLIEAIDMYLTFDYVYLSSSSFSRTLGIFSQGVKLVASSKEAMSYPFSLYLLGETGSFTDTSYYHINLNGSLYKEQLAYLDLKTNLSTV
jgi:hypothetical protein